MKTVWPVQLSTGTIVPLFVMGTCMVSVINAGDMTGSAVGELPAYLEDRATGTATSI